MFRTPRSFAAEAESGSTSTTRARSTAMYDAEAHPADGHAHQVAADVVGHGDHHQRHGVGDCGEGDEDLASTEPVREPAGQRRRDDEGDGLHQGAEVDLVCDLALTDADPVDEVVRLVRDEEGVGHDQHEPAGEGPGEVGVGPWADVEGPGELPQRPGRPACRVEPPVVQVGGERADQDAADEERGEEHRQPGAVEGLDQVGGGHGRRGEADPEDPRDEAALCGGHLVGQDRDLGREEGVEEDLGDAPADENHRDGRCQGDGEGADGAAGQPDDHPRAPHAQAGGRAIAQPAEERVADDREERPHPGHEGEAPRGVVDADEVVDLQGQRHQEGRQEQQRPPGVGQGVQRDERPPDPGGVEGRRGDGSNRRGPFGRGHGACCSPVRCARTCW